MAAKRYVEIPADRLVSELESIGEAVRGRGGSYAWTSQGRERVFEMEPPRGGAVRVYTSLARGDAAARACGKDAVRVCVGATEVQGIGYTFRPLEKSTKILRTAPQGAEDRVAVFLERLRGALREAYQRAQRIRRCPACERPMAQREGRNGPFLGCTGYPSCRKTLPAG